MKHKHTKWHHTLHPDTMLFSILILFVFLLGAFVLSYVDFTHQGNDLGIACTEEAMMCPDGSAVGRSGPYCQFAPCPDGLPNRRGIIDAPLEVPTPTTKTKGKESLVCTQEVKTCPDGSFVGKVGPECQFAPCPDDGSTLESGE